MCEINYDDDDDDLPSKIQEIFYFCFKVLK